MIAADIPTPEQAYLDAARDSMVAEGWAADLVERCAPFRALKSGHRAAVDSAFTAGVRAGYGQGRDDEAHGDELPEWYRLAIGEICQPGQPHACGDFHNAGQCVRSVLPTSTGGPIPRAETSAEAANGDDS